MAEAHRGVQHMQTLVREVVSLVGTVVRWVIQLSGAKNPAVDPLSAPPFDHHPTASKLAREYLGNEMRADVLKMC